MAKQTKLAKAAEGLALIVNPREAMVGAADNVLLVYVTASKSVEKRLKATLPSTVDGFPVNVEYIGKVRPA